MPSTLIDFILQCLPYILSGASFFILYKQNKRLKAAEADKLEAESARTDAEAAKTKAEVGKVIAEAENISVATLREAIQILSSENARLFRDVQDLKKTQREMQVAFDAAIKSSASEADALRRRMLIKRNAIEKLLQGIARLIAQIQRLEPTEDPDWSPPTITELLGPAA